MSEDDKEINRMLMQQLEEDCYLDPNVEVEHPTPAISCGTQSYQTKTGLKTYDVPLGTYGNFSFVQAPPKTKKTFLMSLLAATYLHNNIEGVTGDLKGHRKTFLMSLLAATYLHNNIEGITGDLKGHRKDNDHVVHFDTEQGAWHAQRVFRRPLEMSNEAISNYHTLALRKLSYKARIDFIEYYLYEKLEGKNIGLVIIDGIADLCSDVNNIDSDVNNIEESNYVVQKLMTWTSELNCHIITVIHSNFGSDKATGHLGSFLYKKTETAISLEANTANKGNVTVSCKMSRNSAFETFSFAVNDYGLPKVVGAVYDVLKDTKF